mmetsp:Transcript_62000/g.181196  ORF Transcript_62000/g.181196 Transcript_62000/m.181196 type:complete len:328 (+) Transcript_62000:63-1046(+)
MRRLRGTRCNSVDQAPSKLVPLLTLTLTISLLCTSGAFVLNQRRSATVGPTRAVQPSVPTRLPTAHRMVLHDKGPSALPWSSMGCAMLLWACASRSLCRPLGKVTRFAKDRQVVQCRGRVEFGAVPQHALSVAEQPLRATTAVDRTHVLASAPCLSAQAPWEGPPPTAALSEKFSGLTRMEEQLSVPAAVPTHATDTQSSAETGLSASLALHLRPARLVSGARRAQARHASARATRRGGARTARRSVGARLQMTQELPPVMVQSYDPSRLRTKIQVALRIKVPVCSERSRELDTPSACTGLTEKSVVLGVTYIEMIRHCRKKAFSGH